MRSCGTEMSLGRKHQLAIRVLLGRIFTLRFQEPNACTMVYPSMNNSSCAVASLYLRAKCPVSTFVKCV